MAGLTSDRRRFVAGAALLAAAVLALAVAGGDAGSRAAAGTNGLALDQIGSFEAPVYVDNAPKKPKLLFVVEQPGTIRVLRKGKKLSRPFLDITDRVQYGGEQGLLSVAFHPKYKKNRRFFVYYTNNEGDNQVDRFRTRKKNPVRAKAKSRRRVIEIPHPGASNHNGGQLQFGRDKLLYLAPGDGAVDADKAQDPDSLLGKLLRIKPKRERGYTSPQSNPFVGEAGRDEIYAMGLRNPYRFSFDRKTEDIFIADVGQASREEIDHETLASAKGANFGWNIFEGTLPFAGGPAPANYKPPIHEYATHVGGTTAVIGGFVARDPSLGGYVGRYFYSDNGAGFIRSLDPYGSPLDDADTGLEVSSPGGFGEGAGRRLYVTSLRGPVYRIVLD
jgi:glucose/arabinose dehydrogenase